MRTLQRVQPEDIKHSMEGVYNAIYKLKAFVHIAKDIYQNDLPRISDCLLDLSTYVVKSDMNVMRKILMDYIRSYKINRPISAQNSKYFWDKTFSTLPAVPSITNFTEIKDVAPENKHTLPFTLNIFLSMDPYNEDNSNLAHGPMNSYELKRNHCQMIYDEIKDILIEMTSDDDTRGVDDASTLDDQSPFHFVYALYQQHRFYDCFDELELLNMLAEELVGISNDMEKSFHTSPAMDEANYWSNLRDDFDNLTATSVWLSEQLLSYAANRTTKIQLSNLIGRNTLSELDSILDHVISVITIKGIAHLLKKASELSRNTYRWYKKALDTIQRWVPRYEDRGVRFLHIWRHPVAVLETEDMLQYKYSDSDAWRSWGTSTTLGNFIVSGKAARQISTISKEFTSNLFYELTRIEQQLSSAYHVAIESFDYVISDFSNAQEQGLLDNNFVL